MGLFSAITNILRGTTFKNLPQAPRPQAPAIPVKQHMSNVGLELVKHFESFEPKAYKDPVGIWTIGYGHIKNVKPGDTITQQAAEMLLVKEMQEYEDYVLQAVKVKLNQHQFDACTSLCYNIGVGNFKGSTLVKKLNAGDFAGAAEQFLRWNRGGGRVLAGLTRRRQAERHLFLTGGLKFTF